ncbi:MAG: Bax inhibitor-1/YccA family protein [Deltaproteobacteria bacterium]|nr:Bax inhibitor-1/YccA family protein [Deltaproteobacteria bacterium]
MQEFEAPRPWSQAGELEVAARTELAARFMNQVFGWMAGGLALSGGLAMAVASSEPLMQAALRLYLPLVILELVVVLAFSALINRMSAAVAAGAFLFYAALTGVTFAPLLLIYTGASVANVFFVTAGVFTSMAVYGAVTKRDLTSIGSFLMMGVLAILIASVVNLFLASSAVQFAVSVLGALIFTGLTAYDVQQFRKLGYLGFSNPEQRRKAALRGALNLYLDFINLFLNLLRLFGSRR